MYVITFLGGLGPFKLFYVGAGTIAIKTKWTNDDLSNGTFTEVDNCQNVIVDNFFQRTKWTKINWAWTK